MFDIRKKLLNIAIRRLTIYGDTKFTMRRALVRASQRWCSDGKISISNEEIEEIISVIIKDLLADGLIDDLRMARDRSNQMLQRGNSINLITQDLRSKGISSEDLTTALADLPDNAERQAAITYAKRRKFGIYSLNYNDENEPNKKEYEKQLAAMGRRGFPYEIATSVLKYGSQEK